LVKNRDLGAVFAFLSRALAGAVTVLTADRVEAFRTGAFLAVLARVEVFGAGAVIVVAALRGRAGALLAGKAFATLTGAALAVLAAFTGAGFAARAAFTGAGFAAVFVMEALAGNAFAILAGTDFLAAGAGLFGLCFAGMASPL
jgi:hypothetical protein